jgi:hypothetical protein
VDSSCSCSEQARRPVFYCRPYQISDQICGAAVLGLVISVLRQPVLYCESSVSSFVSGAWIFPRPVFIATLQGPFKLKFFGLCAPGSAADFPGHQQDGAWRLCLIFSARELAWVLLPICQRSPRKNFRSGLLRLRACAQERSAVHSVCCFLFLL